MDYRKARPWIFSFAALAFLGISFWYSAPRVGKQPTTRTSPPEAQDNTPRVVAPVPHENVPD